MTPVGPHWVRLSEQDAAAAVDVLLGNVFSHTPEGTPYAVTVDRHDDRVRLVIDDGGPGMPDAATAVERGASAVGSTGLGLDIATSSARAAGGGLFVARAPLSGARVVIDLPVVEDVV